MKTLIFVGLATMFLGADPLQTEFIVQQTPQVTTEAVAPKKAKKTENKELYPEIEETFIDKKYVKYCNEIGELYSISPELLMSIIEKESRGKASVVNGYGCKGLCQVGERWHKSRMKRLGVTDLLDPYDNILVAADYISELCEEYEDCYTAMAYYGGWVSHGKISSRGTKYLDSLFARAGELEKKHGK